jgi:prophage regulatory protein
VPQNAHARILNFAGLKERGVRFSRQHLSRLEATGQFPARIQLGECSVGWIESEVDEWIRSRPRGPIALQERAPRRKASPEAA